MARLVYLKICDHRKFAFSLSIVFCIIWGLLVSFPEIAGSSEAREIHTVAVMQQQGQYILPLRNQQIPSKPPLFHWLALFIVTINGAVSVGIVRFVSVICAAATTFVSMRLAQCWYGSSLSALSVPGRYLAFAVFAVLGSMYGFLKMAIDARVDMCFALLVTSALYFGTAHLGKASDDTFSIPDEKLNMFWLTCGAAVLAKGPLGIFLPVLLVVVIMISYYRSLLEVKRFLRPCWGWFLLAVVVLPWYFLAYLEGGNGFIQKQLIFENLQRAFGGRYVNSEPCWYYLITLLLDGLPWSLVAAVGLILSYRSASSRVSLSDMPSDSANRLTFAALMSFFMGVLFFSVMSGKRDSYLLPLWPILAIVLGWQMLNWARTRGVLAIFIGRLAVYFRGFAWIILVVLIMLIEISKLPWNWDGWFLLLSDWSLFYGSYVQLCLSGAMILLFLISIVSIRDSLLESTLSFSVLLFALACCLILRLALKAEFKGYDRVAMMIEREVPSNAGLGAILYQHDEFYDPIFFYLNRDVRLYRNGHPVKFDEPFLLAHRSWWQREGQLQQLNEKYTPFKVLSLRYDQVSDRKDRVLILLKRLAVES